MAEFPVKKGEVLFIPTPENKGSAAYLIYTEKDGVIAGLSTKVYEDYRGKGLAQKLVAELAEVARERKCKIDPLCWFIEKEFENKPEYHDVWKK